MKKEDKKAFERNTKKLKYILGHPELKMFLTRRQQKLVKCAFQLMQKQLSLDALDTEASGKDKSMVKEALNNLLRIVINRPMKPILRDLGLEFGLLAFNWNKALGKREDIASVVLTIKNTVEGTLSLTQAINIIKEFTEKLKNMQRFSPPAFELSRAYLKSLEGIEEVD